jgi:hypothetical protein
MRVRQILTIPPHAMRKTGLCGLLIGLVLISSLSSQVGGTKGLRPAPLVGRACQPATPEDADPIEDPGPLEGEGSGGDEANLHQEAEIRLLRGLSRRTSASPWTRSMATATVRACPRTSRDWIRASLPASGRALRHWLQSQTC